MHKGTNQQEHRMSSAIDHVTPPHTHCITRWNWYGGLWKVWKMSVIQNRFLSHLSSVHAHTLSSQSEHNIVIPHMSIRVCYVSYVYWACVCVRVIWHTFSHAHAHTQTQLSELKQTRLVNGAHAFTRAHTHILFQQTCLCCNMHTTHMHSWMHLWYCTPVFIRI